MRFHFHDIMVLALILLTLGVTVGLAQERSPSPQSSPGAQLLIEKLRILRVPETISFLKTVDPKVFADALQTSEGECAMMLASRWSTRLPDNRTTGGGLVVKEFVEQLGREFAQLPQAILYMLVNWKVRAVCPDLELSDEEEQQLLDIQDAMRAGYFLGQLTQEQREAVYEIEDLQIQHDKNQTGLAEMRRDYYALFTR